MKVKHYLALYLTGTQIKMRGHSSNTSAVSTKPAEVGGLSYTACLAQIDQILPR